MLYDPSIGQLHGVGIISLYHYIRVHCIHQPSVLAWVSFVLFASLSGKRETCLARSSLKTQRIVRAKLTFRPQIWDASNVHCYGPASSSSPNQIYGHARHVTLNSCKKKRPSSQHAFSSNTKRESLFRVFHFILDTVDQNSVVDGLMFVALYKIGNKGYWDFFNEVFFTEKTVGSLKLLSK